MKVFQKPLFLLAGSFGLSCSAFALEVPPFLQGMAGCFKVTYSFVENGQNDEFFAPVAELSELSLEDDVVQLKRSLILDDFVQAHWREEWRQLDEASALWEQKVYGPFGDFRYQCSGNLVGGSWRCEAPKAAKPRRDQDKPYAYLNRENTLQVNEKRWVHMQRNVKKRSDDSVYAVEVGWNQYEKQDASVCRAQKQGSAKELTH